MPPNSISLQLKVLDLRSPFTKEELVHAYRTKAFETHPDKGGNPDNFKKVQEAYETLFDLCVLSSNGTTESSKTVEGCSLTDLGKGLGATVNSKDCPECKGKGWFESTHITYGNLSFCPVCGGRGQIKTIFNYPIFSALEWKNWRHCRRCLGLGYLNCKEISHKTIHYCTNCKGTGQVEIHNPVLQKGRFTSNKPSQTKTQKKKKNYCECGALIQNGKCWRCK